jgi:hypothetical protein
MRTPVRVSLAIILYACMSAPWSIIYRGATYDAAKQREAQKNLSIFLSN